jgi:threonine synthase
MWKAFAELQAIGWLKSPKKPRLFACQSDGCAPIVRAFERGERFAKMFENARTVASGLRVPAAVGDFMILDAVRASGGLAVAVPESEIIPWMKRVTANEGIGICPETAVCFAALPRLLKDAAIKASERILVFNTGAAQKYPEAMPEKLPLIDITKPIDWEHI